MRFFVCGSFLIQLSFLVAKLQYIVRYPWLSLDLQLRRTSLAVSCIAAPVELTRLLISGSKKLSAANLPPIVLLLKNALQCLDLAVSLCQNLSEGSCFSDSSATSDLLSSLQDRDHFLHQRREKFLFSAC